MLSGNAYRVSAICHDLRFIVRKEFPQQGNYAANGVCTMHKLVQNTRKGSIAEFPKFLGEW